MSGGAPTSGDGGLTGTMAAASVQRLRIPASQGGVDVQAVLAQALTYTGVEADAVEAAVWYRRAAEGGHVGAIEWMWVACRNGKTGVTADVAEAHRWAARGAEAGSAGCQTIAGDTLLFGVGVAKDEAAGVRWYRRAADAGYPLAQFNLYCCYRDKVGGLRNDDPAAVAWLRKAAEGGYAVAQEELSRCLRAGVGMPADAAGANTWGLRAAEGGDSAAQAHMGQRLLRGEGIATDTVAGVALRRRAVDAGDLDACLFLGNAHAAGLGGLPVDKAAARALYKRAAAGKDAELAATARHALHVLSSSPVIAGRIALRAEIPPVCGHAACGAALDAGTLSGLCAGCRAREEVEVWRRMPLDTLRAAAESGTAAAEGAIGFAYITGALGVAKDDEVGLAWLRKAATQGLLPAREGLGAAAYEAPRKSGADSAARFAEALEWYRPLAEAGDAGAMFNAFVCCMELARVCGDDGEAASHYAEAERWLRGAAALAEPYALNELGVWRWTGGPRVGVACDRAEAVRLLAAADAAGVPEEARAARPAGAPGSTVTVK